MPISSAADPSIPVPLAGHAAAWKKSTAGMIERSQQRSRAFGLARHERPDFGALGHGALNTLIEQNRMLCAHAAPTMETLYQQIANTHNMVILTDAAGVIVHTLGDADFLEKADRVALRPGVTWSEQSKGTNAIGTALAEGEAALVHADQHYLNAHHFLTCSAAPISDHRGNVIGVLDVSGDQRSFHRHTLALVRMSALMIENQLFTASFAGDIVLHFHTRAEFIGTLMEGIVSFDRGGRCLSANRSALFQLGMPLAALQTHTFYSLFGLALPGLYDHCRRAGAALLELCLHNGVRVLARAQLSVAPAAATLPSPSATSAAGSLRHLKTGDRQLDTALDKIAKVIGRAIPILLMGETGTGKEWLAQAIHRDSPAANGPFVAVNCASIPETLIESELFGYAEGAFTGARKKGARGKILQAHGGTLFLDEIGDMAPALQARLLRVLQERSVTPLGSDQAIPVRFELICATHRNLRERIAAGLFREDLYYRINGLAVQLPPLRERSDLDALIRHILARVAPGRRYRISAELAPVLARHRWPGNLRQLNNLLQTAAALAGEAEEIGLHHLPDDFAEEVRQMDAAPATLDQVGHDTVRQTLAAHGGNVAATARALGVSRNTVYRHLRR